MCLPIFSLHPAPDVWLSLNAARMWWCLVFVRLPSRLHSRAINEPSRSFSVQRRPLLGQSQSPWRKLLPWFLCGQTSQFHVYLRCFYACVFIVKALVGGSNREKALAGKQGPFTSGNCENLRWQLLPHRIFEVMVCTGSASARPG